MAQKIHEEIDQQIPKRQLEQKYWQGRISKQQLHVQPHAAVTMAMAYVQFFFLVGLSRLQLVYKKINKICKKSFKAI